MKPKENMGRISFTSEIRCHKIRLRYQNQKLLQLFLTLVLL